MSASAANNADVVVVLVVEDEILVRFDVASCLEDAGYVVVEASTGEAAIAMCNSSTSIDMVITDINLGGFSQRLGRGRTLPNRPAEYARPLHVRGSNRPLALCFRQRRPRQAVP